MDDFTAKHMKNTIKTAAYGRALVMHWEISDKVFQDLRDRSGHLSSTSIGSNDICKLFSSPATFPALFSCLKGYTLPVPKVHHTCTAGPTTMGPGGERGQNEPLDEQLTASRQQLLWFPLPGCDTLPSHCHLRRNSIFNGRLNPHRDTKVMQYLGYCQTIHLIKKKNRTKNCCSKGLTWYIVLQHCRVTPWGQSLILWKCFSPLPSLTHSVEYLYLLPWPRKCIACLLCDAA